MIKRHEELKEIGDSKRKKRGTPTADGAMRVLRAVFEWAMNSSKYDELIKVNPVMQLSKEGRWGKNEPRTRYIKSSELEAFYRAVMGLPNPNGRDYLLLLLFTGLRRTEALKLRWEDVDFKERTITISETKNHKPLTLPMSSFLEQLLNERRAKYYENAWVFPADSKSGHMVEPGCYVDQVQKDSGVSFAIHDIRRTFLTIAESQEIPYFALKALVNHSMGGDVTADYIQISPDRLRDPMQRIANYIMMTAHAWSPWRVEEGKAVVQKPMAKVIRLRKVS